MMMMMALITTTCNDKEKQFHTWSKEATERLSRSADNTNPSTQ